MDDLPALMLCFLYIMSALILKQFGTLLLCVWICLFLEIVHSLYPISCIVMCLLMYWNIFVKHCVLIHWFLLLVYIYARLKVRLVYASRPVCSSRNNLSMIFYISVQEKMDQNCKCYLKHCKWSRFSHGGHGHVLFSFRSDKRSTSINTSCPAHLWNASMSSLATDH